MLRHDGDISFETMNVTRIGACLFDSDVWVGYSFRTKTDRPDRTNTLDRGRAVDQKAATRTFALCLTCLH